MRPLASESVQGLVSRSPSGGAQGEYPALGGTVRKGREEHWIHQKGRLKGTQIEGGKREIRTFATDWIGRDL